MNCVDVTPDELNKLHETRSHNEFIEVMDDVKFRIRNVAVPRMVGLLRSCGIRELRMKVVYTRAE